MNPRYPIYIVSKGRWESRLTSKALEEMQTPYRIVVEPQERDAYASVIDPAKILVLPFSNLGQGSIPARNWIWEHSISEGHARHWIMDDNIRHFYRCNRNQKIPVADGTVLAAAEDFTDRFVNVPMSGLDYYFFVPRRRAYQFPAFLLNTRIYSCILLTNDTHHRWRGRYNEDTDLSLRFLKDGLCTILFRAFLCGKQSTLTMKGGNTDQLYRQDEKFDGRLEMARSLQRQHPDVTRVSRKFGRWQHHVDYRRFAGNKLVVRDGGALPQDGIDDYGMVVVKKGELPASSSP